MSLLDDILGAVTDDDLAARLHFVLELDRLKSVNRRTRLADGTRFENSAEHSWHLATMAAVLAAHADVHVDVSRVVLMLLVHDIVEIDADDTFLYDEAGRADKVERERAAAARIFGILPASEGEELRAAWEEFEAADTAEARFARAVDRLQPLLLNLATGGRTWNEHGIEPARVYDANSRIGQASTALWDLARGALDEAVAAGVLSGRRRDPLAVLDELVLRPTTMQDLDDVLELEGRRDNLDLIGQWSRVRHQHAIADTAILHVTFDERETGGFAGYAILTGADSPVVCVARIATTSPGRGNGRAALAALTEHVLAAGAEKVWLDVVSTNTRARTVYEALGFEIEGVLARHEFLNGRLVDLVMMARFA